jgi:hypothetical protein
LTAEWTTAAGNAPVDYLLSLKIHEAGAANRAFGYPEPEDAGSGRLPGREASGPVGLAGRTFPGIGSGR